MTDMLSQRVADIAGLSLAQREALHALALVSANEAEEQLQVMLRRWSEPMLRRYVAEVLLGGEDHAAWIAQHHAFQTPEQELTQLLGRPLTDAERHPVADITALRPDHQALGAHVRAHHGRLAAKAYLQLVVRESRSDALTDYVDYVLDGRLGHDAWVERHLPRFGSAAGR